MLPGGVATISVPLLADLLGQHHLMLLDVRGVDFFLGYIPGSRRAPFELHDREASKLAAEMAESGKVVVFVCRTGHSLSKQYAEEFLCEARRICDNPSCQVHVLDGGFLAWEQHFKHEENAGSYVTRLACFPGAPHAGLFRARSLSSHDSGQHGLEEGVRVSRSDRRHSTFPTCADHLHPSCSGCNAVHRSLASATVQAGELQAFGGVEDAGSEAQATDKVDRTTWRDMVEPGDVAKVLAGCGRWRQCLVVDCDADTVKVQYFASGRCCVRTLPRQSEEFHVEQPEDRGASHGT